MADLDREDDEELIADVAEDPVIADSIAPLADQSSRQSLALNAGIIAAVNILQDPRDEDAAHTRIHFVHPNATSVFPATCSTTRGSIT
ncbi:hypothetical protein [Actinomyces mediterranea]|uniref:hypothetical protein n=1 Tax=Actinomyces mediterranea TaxID=1871028 RepID=UPI001F175240|nr:hypothetical protein [Actinomyces mediterranea]